MEKVKRKLIMSQLEEKPVVRRSLKQAVISITKKVMVLLLVSLMMVNLIGVNLDIVTQVKADDLTNTVPNDEAGSGVFYSDTINTGLKENGPYGAVTYKGYGPVYGPYNVAGVYQSQSTTSPTSFAAGLPLGTIFIDQSKISQYGGRTEVVSKDTSIIAGLVQIGGSNKMGYDGTKPGAIKMVPGKINELKGDLFKVTFEDAAILPNGDRADLVITYSNARIVIDERYMSAPVAERYYHGAVSLAQGNAFSYGGTDETNMSTTYSGGTALVNTTAKKYGSTYARPNDTDNNRVPATGLTMDATYQIVNKDTTPAAGTFVFAICGINLDRDPDVGGGNNVNKPLWYSYNENFNGVNGKDHSFFSEAMEITGGKASQYVYVRPNTSQEDNPEKVTGVKGQYFYPNVSLHNGNIKFISNALDKSIVGGDGLSGNDNSYNAGFVTLADAATGFKVTATGHGSAKNFMNSVVFNSKQIWYRYTSSSGAHGNIQTTSEGNYNGKLNDGGAILGPSGAYDYDASTPKSNRSTYVVAEGKTVTYTMTPEVGYKASRVIINNTEINFNNEEISKMKKGDSVTVNTADSSSYTDGNNGKGTLTYEGNGVYTFVFNYATADEDIHVDWEPTTADILAYKIWADDDDKDGIRYDADTNGTLPKFKLQWTKNGRDWNDVTTQMDIGLRNADNTVKPYVLKTPVTEQTVPAGKVGNDYKDGTYVINNGTQATTNPVVRPAHPFTWEYLPVYTYDRNGRADRAIQYRIVEINDPWHYEYEKVQYFEHQVFDLTSPGINSIEGWGLVTDGTNTYARKGDEEYDNGLYYLVNDEGKIASSPAVPQPNENNLTNISSNDYWTEDHAVPYHEIEGKNTHFTSDIYVDVVKFWNDEIMKINSNDPADGGNQYARKDINIVLHAEIEGGTVVDLDTSDPNTTDLIKTIALTEGDSKDDVTGYEKIEDSDDNTVKYTKYVDENNNEYAYVEGKQNVVDGYYRIVGGAVDTTTGPFTFNKGAITPVKKNGDGTYKINDDRYGAMFEWLPTHYEGKHIIYTVKETDINGGVLKEWILTGGQLAEVKEGNTLLGYETTMINTPDVDVNYTPVPLTIHKVDKNTGAPLENAEFTVYLDPTQGVELKADESKDLVVGKTIYTKNKNYIKQKDTSDNKDKYYEVNGEEIARTPANPQPKASDLTDTGKKLNNKIIYNSTKNYIIQKDSNNEYKYFEVVGGAASTTAADPQPSVADLVENGKLDPEEGWTDGTNTYVKRNGKYHLVDAENNVDPTEANPQPDPNVMRRAKDLKSGVVEKNVVVTDKMGNATVTFLVPNDENGQKFYYIKETKAPEGYYPDSDPYAFKIDADLKTITLENPNHEHANNWWEKLYDLVFGANTSYPNWAPADDKRGGTLTVEDTPIIADILVRKYWNDNNDQDGKRPGDKNNQLDTSDPDLPTVTLQYTLGAHTADGSVVYTDGTKKYIHKPAPADDKYYEVVNEDVIGTYEYSAANPQPSGATLTLGKTCDGKEVYKGTDGKDYVIIDYVYHEVKTIDKKGEVAATPADPQPDPNLLELVKDGEWTDANVPAGYEHPSVSYVGGPVLTHQNDAYTWTSLPAYMNGKVVVYRILEEGDILDNRKDIYAYDIESNHTSQTHEKTFTLVNNTGSEITGLNQTVDVTNKHETQVINIEVYKRWDDEDPEDRKEAKLYLYKVLDDIEYPVTAIGENGIYEDIGTVPTTVEDGKTIYEWKDLPTYENGEPITYRLKEEKVEGYITIYEAIYTPNGQNDEQKFNTTDIKAEDIKRTFYQLGDDIPDGKKVGSENTTAKYEILNERSVNIKADKTWVNGANASVTYELWRTIKPEDQLTDSKYTKTAVNADDPNVYYVQKTSIITAEDYEALSAEEKAKYENKYVNNGNENDIITPKQWSKLDNTDQEKYEKKYVNNDDSTDQISEGEYKALDALGRNSYSEWGYVKGTYEAFTQISDEAFEALSPDEQAEYVRAYISGTYPDDYTVKFEEDFNALSPTGKDDYTLKYVNKENSTDILSEDDWNNLPNPEQAKYTSKYVNDKHEIISKDTYESLSLTEKTKYDIEHVTTWSPYVGGGEEGSETVDGWELVATHKFDANSFVNPSNTGDTDTYSFNDLLIKDEEGNKYTYRILEKPTLLRFRKNQISDTRVINNNVNVSDGNVYLEVVKEVENRKWLENDKFYFQLEPIKGIDVSDPTSPVDIAKEEVPMPYRIDPQTTATTYNYTADATKNDIQVGAIGRAATFQGIQYKENSALYHSIQRGDVVEFYYRVYEVYDTKTERNGNDTTTTGDKSLDEATNHSGYKDGITYAGKVSNLTEDEHSALGNIGKDSYMQTEAYINNSATPASIINVADYNALSDDDKTNYQKTTGYVNINDASDLITREAYNGLPAIGKNSYTSQQGYLDKNGKAINEREYDKLSDTDKAACTSATIYSAFIPEVHEAKVIVKNVDGIITTETQWLKDGEYKTGAVPVYTNSYSSEGEAKAWIEKNISNRNWVDYDNDSKTGDAFSFKVESISGAQLNVPGSTSSDSYTSKPLMSNGTNNPQADIQKISNTEYAFGLTGNKYDNTMLNSDGEGYFIYEISENPSVTYDDANFNIDGYTVDGLEYDDTKIYVRLKAKDNWDGTISFTVEYFTDASCKNEYKISGHEVWIQDDGTQTNEGKKLVPVRDYSTVEGMSATDRDEAGYRKVDVAYFVNYETVDIPVKKEWVNGPAIEDVNLHLERHLFLISGGEGSVNDADINDEFVKERESGDDFWETAGYTHYAKRAEFLNGDGTPKYDEGSTTTSSNTYENIDGFNLNLPKYEHKGDKTYRIVYRLLEDDASSTYTRSYKSIVRSVKTPAQWSALSEEEKAKYTATWVNKEDNTTISDAEYEALDAEGQAKYESKYVGEIEKANDYIYTDGETLVVTNTVVATNVAKPAAVKQLQGRKWLSQDDFKFILTPVGKYDKDGNYVSTPDIPMPTTDKYVNKDNANDVISKEDYEALNETGKNDYEQVTTGYTHNETGDSISVEDFDTLTLEEQANYTPTYSYTNKNGGEAIGQAAFDALADVGKSAYEPKEINDEAHAKIGDTTVDTEGDLERLARFGDIRFTTDDLVYYTTDKHYHGDFFYEMKEEIPSGVYAVDKKTLEKVDDVTFSEDNRDDYYWKDDSTGLIYDGSVHTVHIKVKENRTNELQIQVAYDEKNQGDTTTGTQFTPVYTNRYDAVVEYAQVVDKYILGRDWEDSDVFDFRMTAMSGAPFEDADVSEFPNIGTHSDTGRETELEGRHAIHSARGAHVKRLFVEDTTKKVQSVTMPKIEFRLSELNKTVKQGDTLKYSDGTAVPVGTAYGQFVYSFEETNDYLKQANREVKDLIIDQDTEYARITVIDKGNGTLDYYTEIFEDRYCTVPRLTPGTDQPAKNPAFVNKLKRDISITKKWVDPATSDVTLRLMWSVNKTNWYYVDDAEWMPAGIRNTQTIKRGAFGKDLTVTWYNLPVYANIKSATDQVGDDLDMNDLPVYYRIVEDGIPHVTTTYSTEPYATGDKSSDSKYFDKENAPIIGEAKETITVVDPETGAETQEEVLITHTYVTNWPEDISGEAKVGVVKQYIGKEWKGEKFTFEITPIESMIGSERTPVKNSEERTITNYKHTVNGTVITEAEYSLITDATEKAKYAAETSTVVNVMPAYNKTNTNKATATKDTDKVSVNERAADFDSLTIKLSQLALDYSGTPETNPNYGKAVGTFFYKVKEEIPRDATMITEGGKTYYVADDMYGNKIKYTTDEYIVKIVAVDDGSGKIDITTSFDDRAEGEYVPVYTNYAMLPTPIEGEKVWIGGEESEHANGTVTTDESDPFKITASNDALKLQVKRKLYNSDEAPSAIDKDDAGRNLVIVWARVETETTDGEYYTYSYSTDGQTIDNPDEVIGVDELDSNIPICDGTNTGCYIGVDKSAGTAVTKLEKYESGDGYYTILAKDSEGNYVQPIFNKVNEVGHEYVYSVTEGDVPEDYEVEYDHDNPLKVINKCVRTDDIKVTKTWDDESDAEGIRPEEITFHLYKKGAVELTTEKLNELRTQAETEAEDINGDGIISEEEVNAKFEELKAAEIARQDAAMEPIQVEVGAKKLTKPSGATNNSWSEVVWEDLRIYDDAGKKINYVVIEESIPGYRTTYTTSTAPQADYTATDNKILLDGEDGAQVVDVKNSLIPATSEVPVKKVWEDNDNVDDKRPTNGVVFTLYERVWDKESKAYGDEQKATYADGTEVESITLDGVEDTTTSKVKELAPDSFNEWNGIFGGLAETKEGKTVIYYVKETTDLTGDGYEEAIVTGNQLDGFTVTNKRAQDTTTAAITKKWEDNNNYLNNRPDTLTVKLFRTYKDGNDQDVHEEVTTDINGYSIKQLMSDDDLVSTNTWKFENNAYSNLPKNVVVDKNEDVYTRVETQDSPKVNGWYEYDDQTNTYFESEDEQYDGKTYYIKSTKTVKVSREYTYYWKEVVPTGYIATGKYENTNVTPVVGNGTATITVDNKSTITNTHVVGEVKVIKTWEDESNLDKTRPTPAQWLESLTLMANDTRVTEFGAAPKVTKGNAEDKGDNKYEVTYSNLPVYDKDGQLISYSIIEDITKLTGYKIEVAPTPTNLTKDGDKWTGEISLTNKHTPNTISYSFIKEWNDDNNKDGVRPNQQTYKTWLKLYRAPINNLNDKEDVTNRYKNELEVIANDDGTFTYDWSNLQIKNTDGKDYKYWVEETLPENTYYKAEVVDTDSLSTNAETADEDGEKVSVKDKGKITNTQIYKDIEVTKIWRDQVNNTSEQALYTAKERPTSITIKLTGDDNSVISANIGASTASATATTSGISSGTYAGVTFDYKFVKVPVYKEDGTTKITYTLSEDEVKNYTEDVDQDTMTVVNTYELDKITGTKLWIDGDKKHNNPTEVKLTLHWISYKNDKEADGINDSGSNANPHVDWSKTTEGEFTIAGLAKYDKDGNTYIYWVSETPIQGYEAPEYTVKTHTDSGVVVGIKDGGTIKNTIKQENIPITGDKTWIGGDKTKANNPDLVLTVKRISKKAGSTEESFVVGNNDDAGNTLKVVWADDTYTFKATNSSNEEVDAQFNKYDEYGYEYEYSIEEAPVTDYATTYDNLDITNKSTKKDALTVKKVWDDIDDAAGVRPDEVTMHLFKVDSIGKVQVEVDEKTITKNTDSETNGVTWSDLPVFDDEGNKIKYIVVEESVAGYTTKYSLDNGANYYDEGANEIKVELDGNTGAQVVTVKNSLVQETDKVEVTKVWNDGDNKDKIRPEKVTLALYEHVYNKTTGKYGNATLVTTRPATQADVTAGIATKVGEAVTVEKLELDGTTDATTDTVANETGAWSGSWINLPTRKNGRTVIYEVKEEAGDNPTLFDSANPEKRYTSVVTGDQVCGFTVTNTHVPQRVYVEVTKNWNDESFYNNPNYSRIGLTFTLTAKAGDTDLTATQLGKTDADMVKTIAANATGADLSVRFTDFPRYYDGTEIVYTVSETASDPSANPNLSSWTVSGGTLSAVNDINTGLLEGYETTFTNTPKGAEEDDQLTLNIFKKDKIGEGPLKNAVFTITKKGEPDTKTDITTGDDGIAAYTITSPGTYYVVEKTAPEGYKLDTTRYEFVVDKNLEKIELKQDTWTKLWEFLFNKLDNPFVQDATNEKLYTLTLGNTSKVSEIAVNKLWKDSNNQDGTRVKTISYTLVAKDSKDKDITRDLGITDATKNMTRIDITEADEAVAGTMSWTNLPTHYNGSKVKYTITETVPSGYTVSYDANENLELSDTATTTVNATNTYDALKTKVTVNKVWEDSNNQDGKRPTSVEMKLYKVVGNARTLVDTKTVSDDTWTYEWTELPVKENGTTIKYYVVETPVADYTIKADSDNGYDKAKEAVKDDTGTFTITNVHEIEKADIKVVKVWDDNNNQDGKRADVDASVQLESKASNETDWTAIDGKTATVSTNDGEVVTWSELPLYKGGKLINYRVVETIGQTDSEYTKSGDSASLTLTKDGTTTVTITNSYEPIEGYIKVTKTWDDKDNVYGERKVTKVHLYKTVDGVTKHVETLSDSEIIQTTQGYETMFGPLPAYEGGKLIKYTVVEEDVNGYKTTITQNGIDGVELTRANTATAPAEIGVTNSHLEEVEITFTKTWDDDNNADNTRPTLGEFASYITLLADGTDVTVANASKLTTSESGNTYTLTWKRLARKTDGDTPTDIEYKVKETLPRILNDIYVPSSTEAITVTWDANHEKGTAAITNSSKTYLEVEKVWDDNNNQDGKRPTSVTVQLLADGTAVSGKTLTLEEANKWSGKFTDLPISNNGTKITYTVDEVSVPEGYTSTSAIANHKATITNKYTPNLIAIKATKVWDEASEAYAGVGSDKRQDVTLRLYGKQGDNKIGFIAETKTIAKDATGTDLTVEWTNLPKYLDGTELTWEIYEDAIPGYVPTIAGDHTNGYTITNTYVEPTNAIEAKKVWEDNNNQDGKRPTSVTFELWRKYVDDTGTDVVEKVPDSDIVLNSFENNVSNGNYDAVADDNKEVIDGYATWYNLPTYIEVADRYEGIFYFVKEQTVDDYTTQVTVNSNGEFEVINVHTPETVNVTVVKKWDDDSNALKKRPDHLTFHLKANGTKVEEGIVLENGTDEWTYTFTNLPKYEGGVEIVYEVDEENVNGYTKNIDGYTITNTLDDSFTDITVTKVWNDYDNVYNKRPDTIKVTLRADDGTNVVDTEIGIDTSDNWDTSDPNKWTYTFHNLPMHNSNSEEIKYEVLEEPVDDYSTAITQNGYDFTVVNTLKKTITVKAEKVWNHKDNPNPVDTTTFTLFANGTEVSSKDITADNLVAIWTELPEFDENGEYIVYDIQESTIDNYVMSVERKDPHVVNGVETHEFVITNVYSDDIHPVVTYVDPLNPATEMISKTTKYDTTSEATEAANNKTEKPADPVHDGFEFIGWDVDFDPLSGYILVAKYKENKVSVSYYDPLASDPLIYGTVTNNPSNITKPGNPSHPKMIFKGWVEARDALGNIVYVAAYECEACPACDECSACDPSIVPSKKPIPDTSDTSNTLGYEISFGISTLLSIVLLFFRRRIVQE